MTAYLTVREVATMARCEHKSVRRAIAAGRLRAFQPTNKLLIREDDACAWIEVTEFLGRARYERAGEPVSHRNGHEPRTVKTTSGKVNLERPRVRNAGRLGFESRILGKGVARGRTRLSRW